MGCYPIGSECCNNCIHWQCHAERKLRGNPPKEVYTDSNLDECRLTGRNTLSKSTCGMFKHIGGITRTFAAPEHRSSDSSFDSMSEITRAFCEGIAEMHRANAAIDRASGAASTSSKSSSSSSASSLRMCPVCHGSKKQECLWCRGSGHEKCERCDGKGGFVKTLEIRESAKTFSKKEYYVPDEKLNLKFYGYGDRPDGGNSFDEYEGKNVICKKHVCRRIKEPAVYHTAEMLNLGEDDFAFPESIEEAGRGTIRKKVDALCKDVDGLTTGWAEAWRLHFKEASIKVEEAPCLVRVEFVDQWGFPCVALVNLANRKVHVYDVDAEAIWPVLEKLARRAGSGDIEMQNVLGQIYAQYPKFKHIAVEKDYEIAAAWFLRAAKGGCADAMDNFGNCLKNGDGVEKDVELAFAWYLMAAKKGLAWGQFHTAKCFLDETGVKKDLELARHWYFKAAKQGLADAQNMAGRCAEEGWGMEKDPEMAFSWYLQAAKNGHATAMHNLSLCYGAGIGCEKDPEKKEKWRKKAREYGYVEKKTSGW